MSVPRACPYCGRLRCGRDCRGLACYGRTCHEHRDLPALDHLTVVRGRRR